MGQLYIQRFENWGPVNKGEFDQAWGVALQTFANSGNWGGVEKGVRHIKTYGTSWGGYALIEVDDPDAFARYQAHHYQNYGHMARVTFDPVMDMDAMFAPTLAELRGKAKR
jgi:hypothetical protein